jgi:hypothetical protein
MNLLPSAITQYWLLIGETIAGVKQHLRGSAGCFQAG